MHPPPSCKVYTPSDLAQAMVVGLGHRSGDTWLDPCCGNGVFCKAIRHLARPTPDVTAVDLDRRAATGVEATRVITGVDFLKWSRETDLRFTRVIVNPPYVAIRRLSSALGRSARCCRELGGGPVTGNANYWYAFLLQSIHLLDVGGSLGVILPAAWEYANYAACLRRSLGSMFGSVEVHRSREPLFDQVSDGSVVVMARDRGRQPGIQRRFEYRNRKDLIRGLSEARFQPADSTQLSIASGTPRDTVRFREVLEIRIGAVTGDSRYFVLSEGDRVEHHLPKTCLVPLVSRACHVASAEFNRATWERLQQAGERVWLFCPKAGSGARGPIRQYLLRSETSGGCQRSAYKIRNRLPWYRTPLPSKADGFVSGMAVRGPFITWNGMRSLTATNTLYVVRCRTAAVRSARFAWGLALLTASVRQQLESRARIYADGLSKLEPGDFAGLILPVPPIKPGARSLYRRAVHLIRIGDNDAASRLADAWFGFTTDQDSVQVRPRDRELAASG